MAVRISSREACSISWISPMLTSFSEAPETEPEPDAEAAAGTEPEEDEPPQAVSAPSAKTADRASAASFFIFMVKNLFQNSV